MGGERLLERSAKGKGSIDDLDRGERERKRDGELWGAGDKGQFSMTCPTEHPHWTDGQKEGCKLVSVISIN